MKAAETSVITANQGDFIVHMSIADKESNSGFIFNQRLIVLNQGFFFGYISKFDIKKDDPKKIDLNQVKQKSKLQIKYIKAIQHDHENLSIKFIHIEKNKQETKKWSFKFANQEMVKQWVYLLQDEKAKRASKSAEKKSRSREANSLSSSKANLNIKKPTKISVEANSPAVRREQPQVERKEVKNSKPEIMELEDSENQSFINPLYGYDSVESNIPKRPTNNQKKLPQPIKPAIQPSPPQRNINTSPKRQNNLMKKQYDQDKPFGRKSPQKSNIQFKKQTQKYPDQMEKLKSPSNQQNTLFNRKPRQSYFDMIEKIVRDSEQKSIEKMKERAIYEQSIDPQSQSRNLYVNGVLEEFIRYDVGETQKWRHQNNQEDDWQLSQKRYQNQLKQLQELQQLAFDIQKQQRNINIQQITPKPVKYTDFSKQIALMLRNKRFEREGHDEISPQKQNSNPKIDIKTMPFSYRYLLATSPGIAVNDMEQDMMDVLVDWREYCQDLMKKIVEDMVQQGGKFKLKTKKNNIMYFDLEQVQVKIATAILKTVHFQAKDKNSSEKPKQKREQRISDYSSAKDLEVEFKDYCALNELLQKSELPLKQVNKSYENSGMKNTHNHSSRLKTPLTAIVEYYGFVALFKLNPKFSYRQDEINEPYIKQKQQAITQMINIDIKWLQQGSARGKAYNFDEQPASNKTLIIHIDQNYYAQLHLQRGQGKTVGKSKKYTHEQRLIEAKRIFDIDVLHQIDSFLLKDYLTKSISNGILRKQLIQEMTTREQYEDIIFSNPQKITNPNAKFKLQADLTLFSGEVLQKLSVIILKLDNMSFYYLHPEQISNFFHKEGVNVRYMGLAFDNLSEMYAKKCLMTEITARICKLLLRKTLQDVLLPTQLPSDKVSSPMKSSRMSSKQRYKNGQIDITYEVMDILNCILGSSTESTALWTVLSQHSQFYFKCELNKQFIEPGYLVASLAYHCRLDVNWKKLNNVSEVFKREDFFRPDNLIGLKVQSKTYEPFSSRLYNSLRRIMDSSKSVNPSSKQETFRTLVQELNLSPNPLPSSLHCLPDSSSYSILSIKQLLSEFIRPQTIKLGSSESNFGHLRVFNDLNQFPQKKSLSIKVSEIKWYLRLKKKEKYLKKFQELVNMLNKFYGDFSPALGELYDVFANFHLANGEYEDAITFAKSSLVNTLKICGTNHIKTAESYYKLSLCYLKASKIQDAYNLLKKSKTIYEAKQLVTTQAYANINLKLGLIMLTKNEIKDAVLIISKALETYEEVQEFEEEEQSYNTVKQDNINWKIMFENEKTECYETLGRCYELGSNRQTLIKNLKVLSAKIQQGFLATIQQPSNLQKILRLILTPHLQSLNSQQAAIYIDVISGLTTHSVQISPRSYNQAYTLIKGRIKENTLMENIESYLENSSSICDYIMLNNVLQTWKSFDQQYERETINDFVSITEELIYFLGEGYLTGVLREVVEASNRK